MVSISQGVHNGPSTRGSMACDHGLREVGPGVHIRSIVGMVCDVVRMADHEHQRPHALPSTATRPRHTPQPCTHTATALHLDHEGHVRASRGERQGALDLTCPKGLPPHGIGAGPYVLLRMTGMNFFLIFLQIGVIVWGAASPPMALESGVAGHLVEGVVRGARVPAPGGPA